MGLDGVIPSILGLSSWIASDPTGNGVDSDQRELPFKPVSQPSGEPANRGARFGIDTIMRERS